MWKRFFVFVKFLFASETKPLDDSERLLEQAQIEMRARQNRSRERAVQALTARDNLQNQCADMRKRTDTLNAKADEAERNGDKEKAEKLRRECERYEEVLIAMEAQLGRAMELCEQVKYALEREERARVREEEKIRKLREALELKAQWRDSQIPPPLDMKAVNSFFIAALLLLALFIVLILIAGACSRYLSTSAL